MAFLTGSGENLADALLMRGKPPNKERLRDFLVRFANGQTIKQIAAAWNRSDSDAEYFWAKAKRLYGLTCPQDAVKFALRRRWITL